MNYCSFTLLCILLQCGLALNPAYASQSDPTNSLERVVDFLLADYEGTDKPGATIGVIRDGKLIFQKGYGMANLTSGVKNNPNVAYTIASASKQFTAFLIASLIQENKLNLTDDIRKYLPEFPDYGKRVTIENLLYHTSGIGDYMILMWLTGVSFEEPFTSHDAIDIIVRQEKLNFAPGERCLYSNSNYLLLAEIIDRVTGTALPEYADQHLFKPMGMNHSGFGKPSVNHNRTSTSYRKLNHSFKDNFAAYGDGGMVTTLADLVQWDHTFYNNNVLTQQILKPGTLANGESLMYGMGIMTSTYRNLTIQTHPGAFLGFRSEILRFPDKGISIICLANCSEINPELITRAIADRIVFGENKNVNWGKSANKSVSADQAEAFTGTFEVVKNVLIDIRYEDGSLIGQLTGQARQTLSPDAEHSFKIGATDDRIIFETLNNGKFQKLSVVQKQGNTPAYRLEKVPAEDYGRFIGQYYCKQQKATYHFFRKNGQLWFKVGSNEKVKASVIKKYNRILFLYQNLEQATIDFTSGTDGTINGFSLNSGRINGLSFVKI